MRSKLFLGNQVGSSYTPDAYDLVILADTPACYWPFSEATGNPQDISGNANHVVTVNGTPVYQQPGLPGGGYSIELDEDANAYFFVADSTTIPDTGALSYEAWIRRGFLAGWETIFKKGTGGTSPHLYIDNDNLIKWRPAYAGGSVSSVTVSAVDGGSTDFHHVVGTRDASNNWLVYLNAVDVTTVVAASTVASNTDQLVIGAVNDGSGEMEGRLAKPAMYAYQLTPTQIAQHFVAGRPLRYPGRVVSQAVQRAGSW